MAFFQLVESFELRDVRSFITASSDGDDDDDEQWHDARSRATSTSFASARGWASGSEASFVSTRGRTGGASAVLDSAAAEDSQPIQPHSPKAATPMREPPAVDAEEEPSCKRARSREDMLQMVVPTLVLGSPPASIGAATRARRVAPSQSFDAAAASFASTFSTTDTVSLQITPAADGSDSVMVHLSTVPAMFLFGGPHAAGSTAVPVTFKEARITDDTADDVAPKEPTVAAPIDLCADSGTSNKDQAHSKKKAADTLKDFFSMLSFSKSKTLHKGLGSADVPPATLVAQGLSTVHVNVLLAEPAATDVPAAASEPDVSSSAGNLEAALHMQTSVFNTEQATHLMPKVAVRAAHDESIDHLLGAAVRRYTEGSEGGAASSRSANAEDGVAVPALALDAAGMPALQASDSPVISARGGEEVQEQAVAVSFPEEEQEATQHDQSKAAKNAYKGLAKVVTRMMPGYTPPYVTASMSLDPSEPLAQLLAPTPVPMQFAPAPAQVAAPKEMSQAELDALIVDEMLNEAAESVLAEPEGTGSHRTSVTSAADENLTIVTPPPEILVANAAARAAAAGASASRAAAPVAAEPMVFPVLSIDGVPVKGDVARGEGGAESVAKMMTEAELMAQLAPGETLVFVNADLLAALSTGQKKRKAEVEVFPEDEGRWAPDAPALKLSLGGASSSAIVNMSASASAGGASAASISVGGGAVSTVTGASTSAGGASAASTSAGGAYSTSTLITSAGGASSSTSTSAGGAVQVEVLPVAIKGGAAVAAVVAGLKPVTPAKAKVEVSSPSVLVEEQLEAKLAEVLFVSQVPKAQDRSAAPASAASTQQQAKRAGVLGGLCACFAPRVQS